MKALLLDQPGSPGRSPNPDADGSVTDTAPRGDLL